MLEVVDEESNHDRCNQQIRILIQVDHFSASWLESLTRAGCAAEPGRRDGQCTIITVQDSIVLGVRSSIVTDESETTIEWPLS